MSPTIRPRRFGFVATRRQYAEHLDDVYAALESDERGGFFIDRAVPTEPVMDVWVAASTDDLQRLLRRGRPIVYTDHGVGLQWYTEPLLEQLRHTALVLAPNEYLAQRYAEAGIRVETVGTPKMDRLLKAPRFLDGRTIALSFHWTSVRSGAAPRLYEAAIRALAQHPDVKVLGHGHPNVYPGLERFWLRCGIEPVQDFAEVVRRADVYACDTSSTLYEFAAMGRPVVILDVPKLEGLPIATTGLRYTDHADIGPHVTPDMLQGALLGALADGDPIHADQRRAATIELYPFRGSSVSRFVQALREMP